MVWMGRDNMKGYRDSMEVVEVEVGRGNGYVGEGTKEGTRGAHNHHRSSVVI